MDSKSSDNLKAIESAATEARTAYTRIDTKRRLEELEGRLGALEVVLEDAGKRELVSAELSSYIKDLREELKDLRNLRRIYGGIAVGVIVMIALILICLVFVSGSPLYKLPPYPAGILIISLITGVVVLTLTLAKGVHRSSVERGKEDVTVDVPQLVTELVKQVKN